MFSEYALVLTRGCGSIGSSSSISTRNSMKLHQNTLSVNIVVVVLAVFSTCKRSNVRRENETFFKSKINKFVFQILCII